MPRKTRAGSNAPGSNAKTGSAGEQPLKAERSAAWLRETAARVTKILQTVVPPLCDHPQSSVRAALTTGDPLHGVFFAVLPLHCITPRCVRTSKATLAVEEIMI